MARQTISDLNLICLLIYEFKKRQMFTGPTLQCIC